VVVRTRLIRTTATGHHIQTRQEIETENKAKVIDVLKEVHDKVGTWFADTYVPLPAEVVEYLEEDIYPDDVSFLLVRHGKLRFSVDERSKQSEVGSDRSQR